MYGHNSQTPMEEVVKHPVVQTHYEYQRVIGEGGQGTVCLYKHKQTGEFVAIKFEFASSTDQSVLNESLFLKKLKDEQNLRIPQYLSHNTINGARYLMIKYLEQSITEHLQTFRPEDRDEAIIRVAIQMVEAVE